MTVSEEADWARASPDRLPNEPRASFPPHGGTTFVWSSKYEVSSDGADGDMSLEIPKSTGLRGRLFPNGYFSELKGTLKLAWPIVLTQLLQMLLGPVALIFCGHIGKIELDTAALANSMINVTATSVATGLSTACDTLFSQTYGSGNKSRLGVYLQQSLIILSLAVIPCLAVQMNIEGLLLIIGQDAVVSKQTAQYMVLFMPGSVAFFLYAVLSKYIQSQNIVIPNLIIGFISNAVNAVLHYLLLYYFKFGTNGSAVCQSVSYILMLLMTIAYILLSKVYVNTWEGWSTEAFHDWALFLKLGIPGMLMICFEWWSFEVGVFMTGLLGTTELGAQSVLFQLDNVFYVIPNGIAIACSIRLGHFLGGNNPDGAKTTCYVALSIVFCTSIFVGSVLFLGLRYQLPWIFTNVIEVVNLTASLLPICALYTFFDNVAAVCQGIFRGSGKQLVGAIIMGICYYGIGLPIGIPVMLATSMGNAGLWWALAGALMLEGISFFFIVASINWEKEAQKAQGRAGVHKIRWTSRDTMETSEVDEQTPLIPNEALPNGFIGHETPNGYIPNDSNNNKDSQTFRKDHNGTIPYIRSNSSRRGSIFHESYSASSECFLPRETVPKPITMELVFQRGLALLILVMILALGILLRFTIKIPDSELDPCLATGHVPAECNVTLNTVQPTRV